MGHVPGYSNNVGHTFGKTTQELFVDPSITHSEKLVLSDKYANDYKLYEPDMELVITAQKKFMHGYPGHQRSGPLLAGVSGRPIPLTLVGEKVIKRQPNIYIPADKTIVDKKNEMVKPDQKSYTKCIEDDTPKEKKSLVLYRKCSGIIPNYLGHIPGVNHNFGKTFSLASTNAKRGFKYKEGRSFK